VKGFELQIIRRRAHIQQGALAERLDIHRTLLSHIETEQAGFPDDNFPVRYIAAVDAISKEQVA